MSEKRQIHNHRIRLGRMIRSAYGGLGLLVVLGGLCALSGCAHKIPPKHYYLLTFAMPDQTETKPYPYTVRVKDFRIDPTYNRYQIVFRYSLHELEYYNFRLWSQKPQKMVSDLIRRSIMRAGLFTKVTEDLTDTAPDFTLTGEIEAIEELDNEQDWFAHLAITFTLVRFNDDRVIWSHAFDQRRQVLVKEPRMVVRTLSEILEVEMNTVVKELDRFLADYHERGLGQTTGPGPAVETDTSPQPTAPMGPISSRTGTGLEQPTSPIDDYTRIEDTRPKRHNSDRFFEPGHSLWFDDLHFRADTTPVPTGTGALFFPSLSSPDREPVVIVSRNDEKVTTGEMGKRIVLGPGNYEVSFGSGTMEQLMRCTVLIKEQEITFVEPFWSALEVKVVDEHFIPFRGSYELLAIPSREEFGVGFGAYEERAEETKVWIIPPGLYKIVRTGGTYRDRTNFATVYVPPGQITSFTLVLDRDSGQFLGAGIIEEEEGVELIKKWKFRSLLGGDLLFLNQTETSSGDLEGWSTTGNLFLDSLANYKHKQHRFDFRLEIEEGLVKEPDGQAKTLNDRLYYHSIYSYFMREKFGPYCRFGLETALTNRYHYFENEGPHSVIIQKADQSPEEYVSTSDRIKIGRPFTPFQMKQGLGGNFNLFNSEYLDLSIRLGFGARQYFANDFLVLNEDSARHTIFSEIEDYQLEGIETSVVAFARATRYLAWSFELDSLFTVDTPDDYIMTLRNVISFRLVSFASLHYKIDFIRDPLVYQEHPAWLQHQFLLRFSFNLF
ncbi:membrane integrity-associated transporter subunit PqiC [bacterium]|nr:membrane integrity-associated transporter subunit PqiC [bacterium]